MTTNDMSLQTDEQLVALVLHDSHEHYRELVLRFEQPLKRYVRRVTNRPEEVDDIVQNTFLKAYRNLRSFDQRLSFSTWIYRIAHNESINTMRSSVIQKVVTLADWFAIGVETAIEEQLDREEDLKAIRSAINQLPLHYREPMILFYEEEKSYDEISDIMRIPKKTVGVRIYRARLQVQALIHGQRKTSKARS